MFGWFIVVLIMLNWIVNIFVKLFCKCGGVVVVNVKIIVFLKCFVIFFISV